MKLRYPMPSRQVSLMLTVRDVIKRHDLLSPGDKIIVAVSGGVDSMVLLNLLASLDDYRLDLVVAHVNHLLRGDESDRDEAFVREAAARLGLPCLVERVDVRRLARERRLSLEEAGREARGKCLERLLGETGAGKAALAHHADDQAETVLLRLLRGSGTGGLAGMSPRSGWKIRPLLSASRHEIAEYAASHGIAFREDDSNRDRRFLRNRIRHELLPLLAGYNPLISRTLGATAAILAADDEVLGELAEHRFGMMATVAGGEITLPVTELLHEPDAVRYRIYRRAIRELKGDLRSISYQHLQNVDRLLFHEAPSGSVSLPRCLRAGRVYGTLRFFHDEPPPPMSIVPVPGYGRYRLASCELLVTPAEPPFRPLTLAPGAALVDLDAAPFPWCVRSFREGDRLVPFGMTGSRKLKDLFIDTKVPRHLRRAIPLLCDGDGMILAVLGVRRSARAAVSATTSHAALAEFSGT